MKKTTLKYILHVIIQNIKQPLEEAKKVQLETTIMGVMLVKMIKNACQITLSTTLIIWVLFISRCRNTT